MNTIDMQNPEKKKLPGSLNVLTILTFIGCGLLFLWTLASKAFVGWSLKMADQAIEAGKEFSAKQMKDIEEGRVAFEMLEKNWVIILVTSLLGIALCFWGALQMRKLKKDGLWIYLAGEWIPVIASAFIMGSMAFSNWGNYIFYAIYLLFSILYISNRKHLVN